MLTSFGPCQQSSRANGDLIFKRLTTMAASGNSSIRLSAPSSLSTSSKHSIVLQPSVQRFALANPLDSGCDPVDSRLTGKYQYPESSFSRYTRSAEQQQTRSPTLSGMDNQGLSSDRVEFPQNEAQANFQHNSRPSQARQKSWHHPYHQVSRNSLSSSTEYDQSFHRSGNDTKMDDNAFKGRRSPHDVSKPFSAHHFDSVPSSRPGQIQEESSFLPSGVPVLEPCRTASIGPRRNRARASTLSLPHPDLARQRVTQGYHISPTYPIGYPAPAATTPGSRRDSVTTSSASLWDEYRSRRDSVVSATTDLSPATGTPPLSGHPNQQSPLLFAPLSPHLGSHNLHSGRKSSTHMVTASHANPATGRSTDSRPATPVSPLNMDQLSVDDRSAPSGLTMTHSTTRAAVDHRPAAWGDYAASHPYDRPRSPASIHGPFRPISRWPGDDRPSPSAVATSGAEGYFSPDPHSFRPCHIYSTSQTMPPHARNHTAEMGYFPSVNPRGEHDRSIYVAPPTMGGDFGYSGEFANRGRGPPMVSAPIDRIAHSRRRRRPPYSYSSLIAQAITSSPEGRMTLREIYTWISNNYPGMYPMTGPESQGWQNTVRHNLSLNKSFIKVARTAQDIYDSCSSGIASQSQAARGKGGWWMLDHSVAASQLGVGQRGHGDDPTEELGSDIMANSQPTLTEPEPESHFTATASSSGTKRLMRQRSYSDSVERHNPSLHAGNPVATFSTAPVSRDGSIPDDEMGRAQVPCHLSSLGGAGPETVRQGGQPANSWQTIPSVLQPRPSVLSGSMTLDESSSQRPKRLFASGRSRGYTTSAAEPSPLRLYSTSAYRRQHEQEHLGIKVERAEPSRPFDFGSDVRISSDVAMRGQTLETKRSIQDQAISSEADLDMPPAIQAGQDQDEKAESKAERESKRRSGRMAISDLLND